MVIALRARCKMGEEAEECNENYLPHFRNIISLPPGYQGISALLIFYT